MKYLYRLLLVIPLLTGCAPLTLQTSLSSAGSPANANAPEGAHPPAMPALMSGNNYAMGPEATGTELDMGDHGGQPMKTPMLQGQQKEPGKPAEHQQHQHTTPQ